MMDTYVLNADGDPEIIDAVVEWAKWWERGDPRRVIGRTFFGDVMISTTFLGIDHNFLFPGPPVLWETMIFGGPHNEYQERSTTRADAEVGHARAVALAKGGGA